MAWSWRFNEKPPLEPDYIWTRGSRGLEPDDERAGRPPEDVADFRERLAELCRALREEARLNALGHAMAYGQLRGAVRTRHALGRLWRRRPGVIETPLAPPIVVVGQMRAGTTRLHRLLAADPAHTHTRLCNSIEPAPRRPDVRPLRCAAGLAVARRINPWVDTLHPFGATRPDEELGWLGAALSHGLYEAQYRIPSFVAFGEARDPTPVYREMLRILRTDTAVMEDGAKPRVLKCPQYAEELTTLLALLPDARLVVARRPLGRVLDSTLSVLASQMAYQSDHVSLAAIEGEWRRKIELRERRMAEGLAGFAGLGLDLTPAALEAMEREQAAANASPHRLHSQAYRRFARE